MEWIMKFATSFRETKRDWFGKKGKSRQLTLALTKGNNDKVAVNFQLSIVVTKQPLSFLLWMSIIVLATEIIRKKKQSNQRWTLHWL